MTPIIDVNQRIEFVSTQDATEPKTIFILRPLTAFDTFDLAKFAENGELKLSGAYILLMLKRSIVDIKNGPDGLNVSQIIDALSIPVVLELMKKVTEITSLTEQDEKN